MVANNTIEKTAIFSPGYWAAHKCKLKLASGSIYTFKGHEYLSEVIDCTAKRQCAMKATGMGFSESMGILPTYHGLIYGRFPQGALYLFPTNDDVQDFSKSRFDSLAIANKEHIGKYVKSGGKGVDSVKLKKVGGSYLYLRGATLQPEDEGSGTKSSKLSGIQVDRVNFDEIRLFNQDAILKAINRMGHSTVQEERYIANPGGEDEDIDIIFQGSDQRYWHRRCGCGAWTCAEEEFPECVKEYPNSAQRARDGKEKGYIACKKCGAPVPPWAGEGSAQWVPKHPSVTDMAGFTISHLTSIFHDPWKILKDYNDPPQGNLGDIIRLDLGRAYSSREDKLQRHTVLANCGNDSMLDNHPGPCVMGVDVGLIKHVVIGIRTHTDRFEILKVAQVKDFNDIHDLARRYNVKSSVVDIRPYEDEARRFQNTERHYQNRVWLCQYTENVVDEHNFNDNTGIVKQYRTGIFDTTHRLITNGNFRFPRQSPAIDTFVQQICNCAKHKVEDKYKRFVYRYVKTGSKEGDHYRNCLNYFVLAAYKSRKITPRYGPKTEGRKFVQNATVPI